MGQMPKGSNQKFKLYRLAQIMQEQTDEEHYITMSEIMKELAKYDITADRKSIYNDLRDLSVLGIEVEGEPDGNRYHYHVVDRAFELPELKLLVDAIQSSKFITEKKSNALIKKLETLVSKYDAQKLQRQVFVSGRIKGKSHLLLILLAVLSLERTSENTKLINKLIDKIQKVDQIGNQVAQQLKDVWLRKKFLPILITNTTGDLNQAFLYGLNDALKREGLLDLVPDTFYSIALKRIDDWEKNYIETYNAFEKEVERCGSNILTLKANLKMYSNGCLYFGALSQKLHNTLVSDPKPYRRDVKQMLANLLGLIERLEMEEITVDRPNYSQRVA